MENKQTNMLMSSVLIPTTPASTRRYDERTERVTPGIMTIRAGLNNAKQIVESPYLPQGWTPLVQPEGQVYFALNSHPRVVTDAKMHSPAVLEKVLRFADDICKTLGLQYADLPESVELYLRPGPDHNDTCFYYLVDHATQVLFWLREVDIYDLELPEVISESHLAMVLHEQYWIHIEQFPSHRFDHLHLGINELISIFVHGEGDQMTSTGSTFPYTAEQCRHFTRMLQNAKDQLSYAPSVCIVARLWAVISRVRSQTYFAQENARLDRNQRILDIPDTDRGRVFATLSRLLYNIPQTRAMELDGLYVDNLVYIHVWAEFVQSRKNEWKEHMPWIIGIAIVNILLLLAPGMSDLLVALSLFCCSIAAGAALMLLARFENLNIRDANDALPYLENAKASNNAATALSLSLPRAMFYHACAFVGAQGLICFENNTGIYSLGAVLAFFVLVSLPYRRWYGSLVDRLPSFKLRKSRPTDLEAAISTKVWL